MTRERLGDIAQVAIAAVISATVACCAIKCHGEPHTPPVPDVKTDTVVMVHYDTITAYKPVPVNVYVVDTLYVPVTVSKTDTVWAQLPKEEKIYQGEEYRAVVSGFRPELEHIEVYQRTQTVTVTNTVTVPPPRWSVGVQAGYGASKDGLTPYIGVGIQYRLFDFRK